jgi:hypothetical protein
MSILEEKSDLIMTITDDDIYVPTEDDCREDEAIALATESIMAAMRSFAPIVKDDGHGSVMLVCLAARLIRDCPDLTEAVYLMMAVKLGTVDRALVDVEREATTTIADRLRFCGHWAQEERR